MAPGRRCHLIGASATGLRLVVAVQHHERQWLHVDWNAAFSSLFGSPEGALSATIAALGAETSLDAGPDYASPHGSMTATLVDDVTGKPDLMQTVTF